MLTLIVGLTLLNCDDSQSVDGTGQMGSMEVVLYDAPANYESVNVRIDRVEVNNALTDTGWVVLSNPEDTYDLLELTNGVTEVIGSDVLEPGVYDQIRLILSREGNSVTVDGNEYDLFIPSGSQTGIKLNINARIEPDITYTLLVDFDAARSVIQRGNGDYLLKPVIRATNEAITGNISGAVEPVQSRPFIYAIAGDDTVSSTKADTTDGSFRLIGLEAGNFTVSVDPTNSTYISKDTSGVEVVVAETKDIGTVNLNQ